MSLNIKSPEAHRLAAELARPTGESMTKAVTEAVRDRLERKRRERDRSPAGWQGIRATTDAGTASEWQRFALGWRPSARYVMQSTCGFRNSAAPPDVGLCR